MCTRHSEPHAHKVQFTKSTGVCLRMLIKNTHVVPAWAPSTAEDGMFTLEAESLLRVKSDGGSPSCSQHLYLEPRRLYSADIGFDLSPLKSQHSTSGQLWQLDTWEMINGAGLVWNSWAHYSDLISYSSQNVWQWRSMASAEQLNHREKIKGNSAARCQFRWSGVVC